MGHYRVLSTRAEFILQKADLYYFRQPCSWNNLSVFPSAEEAKRRMDLEIILDKATDSPPTIIYEGNSNE